MQVALLVNPADNPIEKVLICLIYREEEEGAENLSNLTKIA